MRARKNFQKILLPGEPRVLNRYYTVQPMKTSLKALSVAALCAASIGFTSLAGGCAATATKESTGEYVDDATITTKVKAAFVKDELVKAIDVKVETFKGVVQLSGFVNTSAEKAQAGYLAAGISGVTNVKNNITVK